jgi:hypothetical protein
VAAILRWHEPAHAVAADRSPDTCSYSTSYIYDDFKALNDMLASFQGDGGS